MPDYTVKNMPQLPPGYGPEIWFGLTPNKPHVWLTQAGWREGDKYFEGYYTYALKSKPWYPPSWFGEDGEPLGRIVEHSGGWPTECGPEDGVFFLFPTERDEKKDPYCDKWRRIAFLANVVNWESVVAYMVKPKDA